MIPFWKVEAAGNDFILIDHRDRRLADQLPGLVPHLCHRRFGVGADGVILIENLAGYDFYMNFINADGSGPVMCGNGARAALFYVHHSGLCRQTRYHFRAADGPHEGRISPTSITLTIQTPGELQTVEFDGQPAYLVNTGVPHLVFFRPDAAAFDLDRCGPPLRRQYNANINVVAANADACWSIRTWERGVEGETLACGTGATAASFVIQRVMQAGFPLRLNARGGDLVVDFIEGRLWLSGPTHKAFEGRFDPAHYRKD